MMRQLVTAAMHPRDYDWGLRPWRKHSRVVLMAGLVYISIGIVYICTDASEARETSLSLAINLGPLQFWGGVWITVGALAVISSRWPPASETWGYAALSGMAAWWGACTAFSVTFGAAPGQSLSGALLWMLLAYMWHAIAGLVDPDPELLQVARKSTGHIAPPLKNKSD